MSLNPIYRIWNIEDTAQIQKVLFNTWIDAYASFIPMTDIQLHFIHHYSEQHFAQWFADKLAWSYVAEVQEQIVGYARACLKCDEHRMYLESLYILPAFQGYGIGSKLLNIVEELAVHQGHKAIWLGVMEQNVPSLAWYKKLGFQFVEEAPFHMGASIVNHLIGYCPISVSYHGVGDADRDS